MQERVEARKEEKGRKREETTERGERGEIEAVTGLAGEREGWWARGEEHGGRRTRGRRKGQERRSDERGQGTREKEKRTNLLGLLEVFEIQLEQGLDVIAGESDRDQEQVVLALLRVSLDGIARLRAQPRRRTNLTLPDETVGVAVTEAVHDGRNGRANLGGVRVTAVDDGHGKGVGREDEGDVVAGFGGVAEEGGFDVASDGLMREQKLAGEDEKMEREKENARRRSPRERPIGR